jgi:hypothetical protein
MHNISMACKVIASYDLLTITAVIFFVSVFLAIRHLLVPGVPRVPVLGNITGTRDGTQLPNFHTKQSQDTKFNVSTWAKELNQFLLVKIYDIKPF